MVKVNNEDTRPTSANLILLSLWLIFSRFFPTMNAEFPQKCVEIIVITITKFENKIRWSF